MTIPKEWIGRIQKDYPGGTRVTLVHMEKKFDGIAPGDKGTVQCVSDDGRICVRWDSGNTYDMTYGSDIIRKLTGDEEKQEKEVM